MQELIDALREAELWRQEWFWAIVAIVISVLVFAWEQRAANKISRAGFIYNISNDFANNDRILRVYQWIEQCRRQNDGVKNFRQLTFSTDSSIFQSEDEGSVALDFIDIDTYINHFESVYIILENVRIESVDELFQQRFFTFMMNPYIQKEELFECFSSDVNDFRLCKQWIHSIYRRKHYDVEALAAYLRTYTCGEFELNKPIVWKKGLARLVQHHRISRYLHNYIAYICDPACRYGYYAFRHGSTRKVMRIIASAPTDQKQLLELQQLVIDALPDPAYYYPSTTQELETALADPTRFRCLQVVDGQQIVGFAYTIYEPDEQYDLYRNLPDPAKKQDRCILETVFVHPDYRGYGIQRLLVDVLCHWAWQDGKRSVCATVHPENRYSQQNFEKLGFYKINDKPVEKYGNVRNFYLRQLKKPGNTKDSYTVYPYL